MKILFALLFSCTLAHAEDLVVFAASSLTDVLPKVSEKFEKENKVKIKFNFDASSRLARQIEEGAKAQIFFSADEAWNNYLIDKKVVLKENTKALLSNDLLLITHKKHNFKIQDLKELSKLNFKHIAIAQESVPAGKYGLEALQKKVPYDTIKNKIVSADNVRNVLAWVVKDEADLGIVFATDAKSSDAVKTVLAISPELHSKVIYPVSLVDQKNALAKKYFLYLQNEDNKKEFTNFGFKAFK